ncbi:putative Acetyltransferase [Richelia sinica FACHB-800]|uniref:Acetyltransferase n=1 Tax=Richelia sinica FACHB-800 TaxID=1357546 RepID=A0A975Y5K3_9NOST|nr:GNAT family N-acetyltransferase [Richelia sinica]MBD2665023.1 GNAT family N-acetyltransferase [Richelia sinica FACHB-800]QXE24331.1 putative Acetyltransferase [Richelia sinica FACHB-800]
MNESLQITTQRLELIPCSLEVAQGAAMKNKSQIEDLLGVRVPEEWFTSEVLDFLPTYCQMLEDDPSQLGWGVWLIIHMDDATLIGDLGFAGKPDELGTVEMGYEVISSYRYQGYAFEAVEALVNFAFTQSELKRIIAHCPQDNLGSMRILEKLGMQLLENFDSPEYPRAPMMKWEITLESKNSQWLD